MESTELSFLSYGTVAKGDLLYLTENARVAPLDLFIVKPAIGIAGNPGESCSDIIILNEGEIECSDFSEKFNIGEFVYWTGMKWSSKPPEEKGSRVYTGGIATGINTFLIDVTYRFTRA